MLLKIGYITNWKESSGLANNLSKMRNNTRMWAETLSRKPGGWADFNIWLGWNCQVLWLCSKLAVGSCVVRMIRYYRLRKIIGIFFCHAPPTSTHFYMEYNWYFCEMNGFYTLAKGRRLLLQNAHFMCNDYFGQVASQIFYSSFNCSRYCHILLCSTSSTQCIFT